MELRDLNQESLKISTTQWNLCVICQQNGERNLRAATEISIAKFKECFVARQKFCDTSSEKLLRRLQTEANFKALVGLIPDIPDFTIEDGQKKPTSLKVEGILSDFLATLLLLPDNVDSSCTAYVLSGFVKTMEKIHWKKTDQLYYATLLRILDLLCEMTQETYAYQIDAVLSNDKLYGSDSEFIATLNKYATNICQELLVVLKLLGDSKESRKQYSLTMELFWRVARRGELDAPLMANLAVNLWTLAQKLQDPSNNKLARSIMSVLEKDNDPACVQLLKNLKES